MKDINKLDSKVKEQLRRAATLANAEPVSDDFWAEVGDMLDKTEASKKPRVAARPAKENG